VPSPPGGRVGEASAVEGGVGGDEAAPYLLAALLAQLRALWVVEQDRHVGPGQAEVGALALLPRRPLQELGGLGLVDPVLVQLELLHQDVDAAVASVEPQLDEPGATRIVA